MKDLIHCADLHLSLQEKEYSLGVLDEIIAITLQKKAHFLLLAGDTFDMFPDAEALRSDFRQRISSMQGTCEVLMITGNHEALQKGERSLGVIEGL